MAAAITDGSRTLSAGLSVPAGTRATASDFFSKAESGVVEMVMQGRCTTTALQHWKAKPRAKLAGKDPRLLALLEAGDGQTGGPEKTRSDF